MDIEVRATMDDEMWELWQNGNLYAVVHNDFFDIDFLEELVQRREHGDLVTEFMLVMKR